MYELVSTVLLMTRYYMDLFWTLITYMIEFAVLNIKIIFYFPEYHVIYMITEISLEIRQIFGEPSETNQYKQREASMEKQRQIIQQATLENF